ncbi:hypothetical protein WOLCODRAFT_144772 [Wolfiporia cocos MD-104 SS10]|uniref:Uncharacterized protein n=1 Tax=Wolfiporia cocos (strain MD-104) TaxID=742152 RepID=A0A2H3JP44_WOLCO|nr:hypothetical protein WOLCODRAFT_144772 [Wolfiporia cocos MD-104 SS10]
MTQNTGAHLMTSRITRLFRPLRAKCSSLVDFAHNSSSRKKAPVSVTYSRISRATSRKALADNDAPPLTLLQPPENLGSRIHIDRASIDNMQLSKRIYEVRDAFRNVVQVALGIEEMEQRTTPARVMSLAAMCSAVIGENILATIESSGESNAAPWELNENVEILVMEELYDAVPPHCRSLQADSHTALRALFTASIVTPPVCTSSSTTSLTTGDCPLAHAAHGNYLTALLSSYCTSTGSGRSRPPHPPLTLSTHVFTQTLVSVLCDAQISIPARLEAWRSKAVTRLARELRTRDFLAFLTLCTGLADTIIGVEYRQCRPRKRKSCDDDNSEIAGESSLRSKLAKWVKNVLEHLHQRSVVRYQADEDSLTQPTSLSDNFSAVLDFLAACTSISPDDPHMHSGILSTLTKANAPADRLAGNLICLITHCMVSRPSVAPLRPANLDTLTAVLATAAPSTESYDTLITLLLTPLPTAQSDWSVSVGPASPISPAISQSTSTSTFIPTPPPASPKTSQPQRSVGINAIREYARALRARRLFRWEASLWSTALRHVEDAPVTPCSALFISTTASTSTNVSHAELDALRRELVERVEEAERRSFSADASHGERGDDVAHVSGDSAPVRREHRSAPHAAPEWVYEDIVGSWIQASPRATKAGLSAKRRKLAHDPSQIKNAGSDTLRGHLRPQERMQHASLSRSRSSACSPHGRRSPPKLPIQRFQGVQRPIRAPALLVSGEVAGSDEFEEFPGVHTTVSRRPVHKEAFQSESESNYSGDDRLTDVRSADPHLRHANSGQLDNRTLAGHSVPPRSVLSRESIFEPHLPPPSLPTRTPRSALDSNVPASLATASHASVKAHCVSTRLESPPYEDDEVIDLSDFENIPPPRPRAKGSMLPASIKFYGTEGQAVPNKLRDGPVVAPKIPSTRMKQKLHEIRSASLASRQSSGVCTANQLSSDDPLDMFAYRSSSPMAS